MNSENNILQSQKKAIRNVLIIDFASFIPFVAIALLSGSLLLMSDIIDYLKSITSALIAYNIIKKIEKGKFYEYDYGHGKVESLGGLSGTIIFILGLLFLAGFSVQRIISPSVLERDFVWIGIILQAGGFVVNTLLWLHNKKIAIESKSPLMEMQWRINRADAVSALGVVFCLLASNLFNAYSFSVYIDPIATLIFTLYLIISFIPSLKSGFIELLDKTIEEEFQMIILKILAKHYDAYSNLHAIKSRKSGNKIFIDIILSFHGHLRMDEVVTAVRNIKTETENQIPSSNVNIIISPGEKNDN